MNTRGKMSRLKLTDYDISMKTGFVLEDPLTRLPPYFDPWDHIASNLVQLIQNKTLTEEVQTVCFNTVLSMNTRGKMSRLKLTDYDISMKTGFVLEDPLTRLPPYFDPWDHIASNLVQLIQNKTLTEEVQTLPVLDYTKLNDYKEIKLGHTQLVTIAACYLWQNGAMDPTLVPKSLPAGVAVPLYGMYEQYQLAPIYTYADGYLNNCVIKDPSRPVTFENISAICTLPGGDDMDWFFFSTLAAEYAFAASIQSFQDVLDGVDARDEEKMIRSLQQITEGVRGMKEAFSLIHERLPTKSFILKIGQYFGGYDDGPLADGLVFEGVKDEPVKVSITPFNGVMRNGIGKPDKQMMIGPDAGQTPVFKSLDALLGIEHQKDFHEHTETRFPYLNPGHSKFIYELRKRPVKLRTVVENSFNTELKEAFDELVQAMVQFRSYHMQVVVKYVFIAWNTILSEEQLEVVKPVKQSIINYLKGMRNETKQQGTSST